MYDHGGALEHGLSAVRQLQTSLRERQPRTTWGGPVVQLAVLPVVGAMALLLALSGPVFTFSAVAAVLGIAALTAPSAASFVLARRAGREPAAVMAWGTLCLQLTLTVWLSLVL